MALPADLTALARALAGRADEVVADAVAICEIPAPTFHEARRARHVLRRMRALGLDAPRLEATGNVVAELPGAADGPTVVLMAHLDTVFEADARVQVRREGTILRAPGIGDNSLGVAGLLWLGRALRALPGRGTLVLVANTCEEGLGDLRGARAAWDRYGARADAWVVLEGATFNRAVYAGICSRRLDIAYRAAGGHSWLDFGRPSAVHAIGRLVDQIAAIRPPREPRTTYNVGVVRGGTTVNSIAASAGLLLDMRSEDPAALDALDRTVRGLAAAVAAASDVEVAVEVVGDRPGGRLPDGHPLFGVVAAAAATVGVPVEWESGSTDANVPLSHGAAAVCLGLARGEGAHTRAEAVDVGALPLGLTQACLVAGSLLRRPAASPGRRPKHLRG